ncbi:uncharacterized protein LOC142328285 [Lycorma delicatula]|uniref:uncharacterized protein LOC142328285 n=1 Tax=Lycorma delicatula TaxID=130591 RepID=UPI003F519E32
MNLLPDMTQASVQNKENLNAAASRSSTEATGTSHSESTSNKTSGTSNIISNDIVNSSVTNISDGKVPDSPLHEFISDTFTASKQDLLEVEQNMKKLGITDDAQSRSAKNEEEWENVKKEILKSAEANLGGIKRTVLVRNDLDLE